MGLPISKPVPPNARAIPSRVPIMSEVSVDISTVIGPISDTKDAEKNP